MIDKEEIIRTLGLEPHPEGGYFRRTSCSSHEIICADQNTRPQITSIFYLLSEERKYSYFTRNKSDLVLFYHLGEHVKVYFLLENGSIEIKILGPSLSSGQNLQIFCPRDLPKAYEFIGSQYVLLGEAVSPGFDYQDMEILDYHQIVNSHPQAVKELMHLIKT